MITKPITLLHRQTYPEQKKNEHTAQLRKLGFMLLRDEQLSSQESQSIEGVLIQHEADKLLIEQALAVRPGEIPLLALVYGEDVPHGLAELIQTGYKTDRPMLEVVRLFLVPNSERAVMGGDNEGHWMKELRCHLAEQQIITLVCRRVEVDEVARHLPLYLSWKKRFYQLMGEKCDESNARLEVVAQALGMDKRVGQGWFPPVSAQYHQDRYLPVWLTQEWQYVTKKTNIHRVAVWGTLALCNGIVAELAKERDIRLYISAETEKPNEQASGFSICEKPEDTLDNADLLLILTADQSVSQLSLHELTNRMKQQIVIDACSCYPLQEIEEYGIKYRTYGQNTNVWEWN